MSLTKKLINGAANLQHLKLRTHLHHLNITGLDFISDHGYLGDLYSEFDGFFDDVAELVRINGEKIPSDFMNSTILPSVDVEFDNSDKKAVFSDISLCVSLVLETLTDCHKAAIDAKKIGTYTELENIISSLEKTNWKLKSITA